MTTETILIGDSPQMPTAGTPRVGAVHYMPTLKLNRISTERIRHLRELLGKFSLDAELMGRARSFQEDEIFQGNRADIVAGVVCNHGGLKKYKLRDELGNTEEFERHLEDSQSEFTQRSHEKPVLHDRSTVSPDDDANAILGRLNASQISPTERCHLVLQCETVGFSDDEKPLLCRLLTQFVDDFRDSQNVQELVAVSAAVRKLVFNVPADDLEAIGSVLSPGHRAGVSEDVELEASKSVIRRLAANGLESTPVRPDGKLVESLEGLVRDYLRDRLLHRDKYGAIAINSLLALTLSGSNSLSEFLGTLQGLRSGWFKTLVARRAGRIVSDLQQRFGNSEQVAVSRLKALVSAATPS